MSTAQMNYTTHSNITYCTQGGVPLHLDLYLPRGSNIPVVVYIHGGRWETGSKADLPSWFLTGMTNKGFAVASIDYRLSPRYVYPAQEQDVECAIRFLRAHAGNYGLNSKEFVAYGESSGAQLAAMLGLPNTPISWVTGQYNTYSSRVQAVATLSAPTNLTESDDYDSAGVQAIGTTFPTNQDRVAGSPVTYTSGDSTPFLVVHGMNDTQINYIQSVEFAGLLPAVSSQLLLVDNAGHGLSTIPGYPMEPPLTTVQQDIVGFLGSH